IGVKGLHDLIGGPTLFEGGIIDGIESAEKEKNLSGGRGSFDFAGELVAGVFFRKIEIEENQTGFHLSQFLEKLLLGTGVDDVVGLVGESDFDHFLNSKAVIGQQNFVVHP